MVILLVNFKLKRWLLWTPLNDLQGITKHSGRVHECGAKGYGKEQSERSLGSVEVVIRGAMGASEQRS
jgi:hypothetical protein